MGSRRDGFVGWRDKFREMGLWFGEMGRRVGWRSREEMRVVLERRKKKVRSKRKRKERSQREREREGERKKKRIFFLMREEREV